MDFCSVRYYRNTICSALIITQELQKINSYKAPYDKFLCVSEAIWLCWPAYISRCWEIISHCVSLLDDPGVDVCWSIMAFVIFYSGVDNIISNLQYPDQWIDKHHSYCNYICHLLCHVGWSGRGKIACISFRFEGATSDFVPIQEEATSKLVLAWRTRRQNQFQEK